MRNKYVFDPESGIVSHARTGKEAGGPTDAGYRQCQDYAATPQKSGRALEKRRAKREVEVEVRLLAELA